MINSGDLRTLANGLFPSGGSEAHLTPEGRDEIRDAIDVILKFWDYRNTKLSLALEQLDKAADEISRLRAENEKLVEALRGMLLHACVADAAAEDKDSEDHEAERKARAALREHEAVALLSKTENEK